MICGAAIYYQIATKSFLINRIRIERNEIKQKKKLSKFDHVRASIKYRLGLLRNQKWTKNKPESNEIRRNWLTEICTTANESTHEREKERERRDLNECNECIMYHFAVNSNRIFTKISTRNLFKSKETDQIQKGKTIDDTNEWFEKDNCLHKFWLALHECGPYQSSAVH